MAQRADELIRLISDDVSSSQELESSITESAMHFAEANRTDAASTIENEASTDIEMSEDLGAVGGEPSERDEGSRYPICRLSKFSQSNASAEAIELAQVAACNAKKAGKTCRITMRATLNTITVGKKKVEAALQAAENAGEAEDAEFFRDLAAKYGSAIESASKMAISVDAGGETADTAASEAEEAATNLAEAGNEASAASEEKLNTAYWAANTANAATILAYKMEFAGLKDARKCWKAIDDSENSGSPKTNSRRQSRIHKRPPFECAPKNKFMLSYQIVSFIFGSILMTLLGFVENGTALFYLILTFGLLLMGLFVGHLFYSLFKDNRTAAAVNETTVAISLIDERLNELRKYFDENNITPDTSGHSSEVE